MKLINILFEETPSQMAKKMGLERKPGFGNYGPKGSNTVTHRSRGGKLVPTKAKASSAPRQPEPSANKWTEWASEERIRQFASDMFPENGNFSAQSIYSAVANIFGSKNVPEKIGTYEETFPAHEIWAIEHAEGVYNIADNTIGIAQRNIAVFQEVQRNKGIPADLDQANVIKIVVHESIHATCPRTNGEYPVQEALDAGRNPELLAYEEGMTEFLALEITGKALKLRGWDGGVPFNAYKKEVDMIAMMVTIGGMDVVEMNNKPYAEMRDGCREYHNKTLATIMERVGFSEEDIAYAMRSSQYQFDRGDKVNRNLSSGERLYPVNLLLTNNYIVAKLSRMVHNVKMFGSEEDEARRKFIEALPVPE